MAKYICEGTCGGSVSEEDYKAGKTTCGTPGCTHKDHPFVRVEDDSPMLGQRGKKKPWWKIW